MTGQGSFWDTAAAGRYEPAQLWYDSTDKRLVVLVNGKEVPVAEPVLPGLEVVPDVRHVGWNDPVNAANQAHVAACAECTEKFGGRIVGTRQPGAAGLDPKKR